jgi:hypothetical protein
VNITAWRVIWYDADGHELGSEEFADESEARRKLDRVRADRLGRSVTLDMLCQTDELSGDGVMWDLVQECEIRRHSISNADNADHPATRQTAIYPAPVLRPASRSAVALRLTIAIGRKNSRMRLCPFLGWSDAQCCGAFTRPETRHFRCYVMGGEHRWSTV